MKGRKTPKTPVKPAGSPWWGNETYAMASTSNSNQANGSGLDLSSLPKLGQQPAGIKSRSQTPLTTQYGYPGSVPSTPKVPPTGPIGAPSVAPSVPPGVVDTREPLDQVFTGNRDQNSHAPSHINGRIPLHLPYLDAPPNKPSAILKSAPHHEPKLKANVSDSDRFGLKPLLEVLTADSAGVFSPAVGTEIPPIPQTSDQISKSFASPWAETSKHCIIPEYTLPSCYTVQSVVPQQQKLQNLTEETLFYIFYTMPRDAMQEAVAVELTNRNWRYHKDLKLWLTKDPLSEPVQINAQAESGVYVFFDPSSWEKVKKEYILYYPDIA